MRTYKFLLPISLALTGSVANAELLHLADIPKLPQDTVSELSQRFQYKAHG